MGSSSSDERRREQNRLAQRRFRQKHRQQREAANQQQQQQQQQQQAQQQAQQLQQQQSNPQSAFVSRPTTAGSASPQDLSELPPLDPSILDAISIPGSTSADGSSAFSSPIGSMGFHPGIVNTDELPSAGVGGFCELDEDSSWMEMLGKGDGALMHHPSDPLMHHQPPHHHSISSHSSHHHSLSPSPSTIGLDSMHIIPHPGDYDTDSTLGAPTLGEDSSVMTVALMTSSPLHVAAQKGNSRIARLLLKSDGDCNRQDEAGLTPLLHATIEGHEDVADLLLAHGAGMQYVDHQHRSVLHWAVLRRHDGLLRKLLKFCMSGENAFLIEARTKEGCTPLYLAVNTNNEAAVEQLLEFGAKVR